MKIIVDLSKYPKQMEYVVKHAINTGGEWEDVVRELVLAGGQRMYPNVEPESRTGEPKRQPARRK